MQAGAVLEKYPRHCIEYVTDCRNSGSIQRRTAFPTVYEIGAACEAYMGPHYRRQEVDRRAAEQLAERKKLEVPRDPRVLEKINQWRRERVL